MKFQKTLLDDSKKAATAEIIKTLNGMNFADACECLNCAKFLLSAASFVDFNAAESIIDEDD